MGNSNIYEETKKTDSPGRRKEWEVLITESPATQVGVEEFKEEWCTKGIKVRGQVRGQKPSVVLSCLSKCHLFQ
jgi:hypothetical protein